MATPTYKYVLTFGTDDGGTLSMNVPYADYEKEADDINSVMDRIITNGSVFVKVPTSKKSAKLVKTEETTFAVDE